MPLVGFALFFVGWLAYVAQMFWAIENPDALPTMFLTFGLMLVVNIVTMVTMISGAVYGTVLNWTVTDDTHRTRVLWTVGFYVFSQITMPLFYWTRNRKLPSAPTRPSGSEIPAGVQLQAA